MHVCKNCGESMELVNCSTGPTCMGGGAYKVFRHCRKSVAEPGVAAAIALDQCGGLIREVGTELDQRTSFRGTVKESK